MCRDLSGSNCRSGGGMLLGSHIPEKLSAYYIGECTLTGIATFAPGEGATDLAAVPAA